MKVLVTGSAGIIGCPVVAALALRGHAVRGFDRRPTPGLADAFVADLADEAAVREAVRGMEAVVHLAAQPDEAPFAELVGPNVIGLYHVMNAAREASVRRLVLASSIMVVKRERGMIARTDQARPANHYAVTKLFAEQMGELYARAFGMSVIAARIGWVVRTPEEARRMQELAIPDMYLSRADAGRFFVAAVEAEGISFAVLYAASRGGERVFEVEPTRRLLGYEPRDRWPEGLPFDLPRPDV
jgi:nucleoside-diphosphate-sugar epimerase